MICYTAKQTKANFEKRAEIPVTTSGYLQLHALITCKSGQHFVGNSEMFAIKRYCLNSYREGLHVGTSLLIMELATIDPQSQKEHTEIHKIPKFGVNRASFD